MTDTRSPATPICDHLKASGEWNPNWEPFYELDPVWTEKFMAMGTAPMLSRVLDAKTVEFIAIAVDASCTHMYGPGVRRHIRKAHHRITEQAEQLGDEFTQIRPGLGYVRRQD